jgi:photosystem I P700 chlorophyll a apoprotein A1
MAQIKQVSQFKMLAKGAVVTTSIWALHALPNDLSQYSDQSRRILASHLIHLAIVFSWLATLSFQGAYFTNFSSWCSDSFNTLSAGGVLVPSFGQAFLNEADDGQYQFTGLFFVWRAIGQVNTFELSTLSLVSLALGAVSIVAAYLALHKAGFALFLARMNVGLLAGFGSFSWAGQMVHVSYQRQALLSAAVTVDHLTPATELLSSSLKDSITVDEFFNSYDGAISTSLLIGHHLSIGFLLGFTAVLSTLTQAKPTPQNQHSMATTSQASLAVALGCVGSACIVQSFIMPFMPAYGGLNTSFSTIWALYCHHYWLGIISLVGASSHLAYWSLRGDLPSYLSQRDIIIGHLTWVSTFLGTHSVGMLIHNDSMEALGRHYDTFSDTSLQVRPVFLNFLTAIFVSSGDRLSTLGTADLLVFHVESFCIHTTVLILAKGVLMSRSSRLVADKGSYGFLYPCDGPGRGGTCQISPWDHVFLGAFWAYNTGSVLHLSLVLVCRVCLAFIRLAIVTSEAYR